MKKNTISEKDAFSFFKESVSSKFPGASFTNVAVKRFSSNSRIVMPAEQQSDQKKMIIKFKAVLVTVIPKKRYEPIMIYTKNKQLITCARLSTHGGHVAVEIARKLAKQYEMKLVVLGNNVLCFMMLDLPSMDAVANFFDASIEKLLVVNDEFNARISKLIA